MDCTRRHRCLWMKLRSCLTVSSALKFAADMPTPVPTLHSAFMRKATADRATSPVCALKRISSNRLSTQLNKPARHASQMLLSQSLVTLVSMNATRNYTNKNNNNLRCRPRGEEVSRSRMRAKRKRKSLRWCLWITAHRCLSRNPCTTSAKSPWILLPSALLVQTSRWQKVKSVNLKQKETMTISWKAWSKC